MRLIREYRMFGADSLQRSLRQCRERCSKSGRNEREHQCHKQRQRKSAMKAKKEEKTNAKANPKRGIICSFPFQNRTTGRGKLADFDSFISENEEKVGFKVDARLK